MLRHVNIGFKSAKPKEGQDWEGKDTGWGV